MKKIIQFFLLFIITVSTYIFYNVYFVKKIDNDSKLISKDLDILQNNNSNQIKNLQYKINFDGNKQYTITSEFSELIKTTDFEIVKMQKAKAILIDEKKLTISINSDNAEFNSGNYNTIFKDNVLIEYMNNKILSDKLYIDFNNNIINISQNVSYSGELGKINTDNIVINLLTKKIDIFMSGNDKNVELIKN